MRSIMRQAFVRLEPRDRGDAALRLVQEIRRRAERAAHRAVVERDQAHRADLGETGFARRLGRQGADAIGRLETIPVRLVRHAFVRRGEDRVAQLFAVERAAAAGAASCRRAGARPCRRCRPAADWMRKRAGKLQQRPLAFAEHDAIERTELEHELGSERGLHAARDDEGLGRQPAREMRQLQIESQASCPWWTCRSRPRIRAAVSRSSARSGGPTQQFGSKTLTSTPCGREHASQSPHAERRRQEGVFPAMWVVRPHQQKFGQSPP